MRRLRDEAGFSMLELIIYISIIGVLLMVALPKYNNAMTMANTARIQADLQILDGAIMRYYMERGQYPTAVSDLGEYVKNAGSIQPPSGKYQLRDGTVGEITTREYTIDMEENEALCDGHPLADFGRPNRTGSGES